MQHWIRPEIIYDPDEGQRVRNIGKVIKIRILGKNENKIVITVGVGGLGEQSGTEREGGMKQVIK